MQNNVIDMLKPIGNSHCDTCALNASLRVKNANILSRQMTGQVLWFTFL